ncbi:MAG: T9SS type A sorting domain-containing protein [Bacteroidales bacterium]|nr:T9SS type A sorting domain-containing protein [Bacteroidales bacterium]MCF8403363.1 T9SS type A sorting domain-containing protein [Bacteroidales bacterium]
MKKHYNLLLILVLPLALIFFTSETWSSGGSPGGKTGSPGDGGQNCTGCHLGTPQTQEFWIYSPDLLVSGYNPGQTYNVFVIGIDANANKFGFEATAEDASGNKVGTFQTGFGGFNQVINNGSSITHTALGTTPLTDSGTVWFFDWVAPVSSVGEITFYAAINAANGNGANTGDQINLSHFSFSPSVGISEDNSQDHLSIYPNPSSGVVNVKHDGQIGDIIQILNLTGQVVFTREINSPTEKIDLSSLGSGVFFIKVGDYIQRLVIK